MSDDPLRLAVITGSTREGRFGRTVGEWVVRLAKEHDYCVDDIDLALAGLPAVHLSDHDPATKDLADRLEHADAFVIVTPEYNHGYPAGLKHAIDTTGKGWRAKPVGLVSYGGISGGIRAAEQLRQVFPELHSLTIRNTVAISNAWDRFDASGAAADPRLDTSLASMLDQLHWWGRALRDARIQRPYGA